MDFLWTLFSLCLFILLIFSVFFPMWLFERFIFCLLRPSPILSVLPLIVYFRLFLVLPRTSRGGVTYKDVEFGWDAGFISRLHYLYLQSTVTLRPTLQFSDK